MAKLDDYRDTESWMRIERIEFKGIKSFDDPMSIEFAESTNLFALSGKNGAGKSTILKMPWLVQKAHFVSILQDKDLHASFAEEVGRFFTGKDSYINLHLLSDDTRCIIRLFRDNSFLGYGISYTDKEFVDARWKVNNPSDVILYVDASKGFSEATFKFGEINIEDNDKSSLAIEAILNPEQLFTHMYRQLVKDYVHGRLIPSKPDRLLYYQVASKMFTKLIPRVELKNFSGKHKPGEFVLLGKANREKYTPQYDVREFSSGEKALLSTLVFLCISRSVSTLIIDEPENHFHESLLLEFMSLLHKLCSQGGINGWAESEKSALKLDWVRSEYKNYNLNQVFVSTHSRSLIYKFFLLGENKIVDEKVTSVDYEGAESVLRQIGLSSSFSKVLLVEGQSDNDALENALSDKSVKIKSLDGSTAVIDTFSRISKIKDHLQHSTFVFLVDSDNKGDDFFAALRAVDEGFYDKTFIRLDAHEFENLFLDADAIRSVIDGFVELTGNKAKKIDLADIKSKLVEIARTSLPRVYRKELSLGFQRVIERHFAERLWGNSSFDWASSSSIESQLEMSVLSDESSALLNETLKTRSEEMFASYDGISDDALLKRCDGKEVLGKTCGHFSKHLGMSSDSFRLSLYKKCLEDPSSLASAVLRDIVLRLG